MIRLIDKAVQEYILRKKKKHQGYIKRVVGEVKKHNNKRSVKI